MVRVLRVWYSRGLSLWDVVLFMRTMLAPHLCTLHLHGRKLKINLDNATRSCLQMRFHTVSSLSIDGMQPGQVVYILRAFPALRSLRCTCINISDTKRGLRISQQIPRSTPCPQLIELKVCQYIKCGCRARANSETQVTECNAAITLLLCRLFGETIEKLAIDGRSFLRVYNFEISLSVGLTKTAANRRTGRRA